MYRLRPRKLVVQITGDLFFISQQSKSVTALRLRGGGILGTMPSSAAFLKGTALANGRSTPPAAARLRAAAARRPGAAMAMAATVTFRKYQGLGNDFILVDNRDSEDPKITPEQVRVRTKHITRVCEQP